MNITLYLQDKIVKFKLPNEVSGSFSFDWQDVDNKLINIDAVNSSWVLHKTDAVKILSSNNEELDSIEIVPNNYYILEREGTKYLFFVEENVFNNMISLQYDFINPLLITNNSSGNITYTCPFYNVLNISIYKRNETLYLQKDNNVMYKNGIVINEPEIAIKNGDELELCGLRMLFIDNDIYINQKENELSFNNVNLYHHPELEKIEKKEIKDVPLYKKDDYYSKSPRIRRLIEEKEIKFDRPPNFKEVEQLPALLTIGPMITMGATSGLTLLNLSISLASGTVQFANVWPQLLTSIAMMTSMFLWPLIIKRYNKKRKEENDYELSLKYAKYFDEKKEEFGEISKQQSIILFENLITVEDCLKNIDNKQAGFWDKRLDQNDFLVARLGIGREKLRAKIAWPEEGFTIDESQMKKRANELVEFFKYIEAVPVGYSFAEHKLTAIMGKRNMAVNFLNNIILQLISFYPYDDLKLVVITNEENKKDFEYFRYLNHSFNNNRTYRYFASNVDEAKNVTDVLMSEINYRIQVSGNMKEPFKPHYLIIVDDYSKIKSYNLINIISETEENIGCSIIFLENKLSNLPSKCDNFITLGDKKCDILYNAFDEPEQGQFNNEIRYNIDMMALAKKLSNIPVEIEDEESSLPESITFLEMENVGKVEQLNILNRWRNNDPTRSLRAEVGVDSSNNIMYLDLHEKYHGPHGLIAGMTGSGKSEFIITYILSMAMNYSPDEVSFILIDYKGGGLAGAFENKVTGIVLPHLAGTITNLDKAEMDRTLVSIDSELKRRQRLFNEARDNLGESTMDIYKYQKHYLEGTLTEAIPHLFIICDEFAELKSQQPDFMDSLISTARIGRSLGVHLILATQKPSGVVNDQIWSNTKFRVCLKVQDASDSKEMLKKDDAASLKQTGRFYLQVGYDEYYALGQSAWCGAKYFPSDKIVKQVDKSINFIDDSGDIIKSIQESNNNKVQAQGEQITSILKYIIDIANELKVKSRRLWLENIPELILENALETKYGFKTNNFDIEAIIGEYDAPELQEQGLVKYNLLKDGNTIIYGNDSVENEMLFETILYSITKNYSPNMVNFYMIDLGSESLRNYGNLPHFSGYTTINDTNRINNLFGLISDEISKRKKILSSYGGDYSRYIKSGNNDMPVLVISINNYEAFKENFENLTFSALPEITRDSYRYGIIFIISAVGINAVRLNVSQNFNNFYTFKLKEAFDYQAVFGKKKKIMPRDILGRGIINNGDLHEFQVASITNEDDKNEFINKFVEEIKAKYEGYQAYLPLPILPDVVGIKDVEKYIDSLENVPVGISTSSVKVSTIDFTANIGFSISSNSFATTLPFTRNLIKVLRKIGGTVLMVIDPKSLLNLNKDEVPNYYTGSDDNRITMDKVIDVIKKYVDDLIDKNSKQKGVLIINGIDDLFKKISDIKILEDLTESLKKYENITTLLIESSSKFKNHSTSQWVRNILNTTNGIWIGNGITSQNVIMCSAPRNIVGTIKDDIGFVVTDSNVEITKILYSDNNYN